jgi:hypothetical protein
VQADQPRFEALGHVGRSGEAGSNRTAGITMNENCLVAHHRPPHRSLFWHTAIAARLTQIKRGRAIAV